MTTITISILNDCSDDLFVQVWDLNQPGSPSVFYDRVNVHQVSATFPIYEDGNGYGSIKWHAENANDPSKFKDVPQYQASNTDPVPVSDS
jgi:hypothetical protein